MKIQRQISLGLFLGTSFSLFATAPWVVGGGQVDGHGPSYAAFVEADGTLVPINNIPFGLAVGFVSMNTSGQALLTGFGDAGNYCALTSYNNPVAVPVVGYSSSDGMISNCSLNVAGKGLIVTQTGKTFFITPNGTATPLPTFNGALYSSSLNDAGVGIIGGQATSNAIYAGYVSASGTITPIFTSPLSNALIQSVTINNSGAGIMGGMDNTSNDLYAALVAPGGALVPITSLSTPQGWINAVAMNENGVAIIGGSDSSGPNDVPYVAIVHSSTNTVVVNPSLLPATGNIVNVAINSSGVGMVCGVDNTANKGYAAFVSNNGTTVQSLVGLPDHAVIASVGIDSKGKGLIGGVRHEGVGPIYLALVAPNGTVTELSPNTPFSKAAIFSVANSEDILNLTVADSAISSFLGVFNMQLRASYVLEEHFRKMRQTSRSTLSNKEISFVAGTGTMGQNSVKNQENGYSAWAAPFYTYIHQAEEGVNPYYQNNVVGGVVAVDRTIGDFLIGGGFGYAYNFVHYGDQLGKSDVQEETLFLYANYQQKRYWINGAIWGGIFQLSNYRHPLPMLTSTGNTNGWIFNPHIEMGVPYTFPNHKAYTLEGFFDFDFVNSWQKGFTEEGSSGLNLVVADLYTSLLRSETGIRFYQKWSYDCGEIAFQEKASYVNLTPFHFNPISTSYVASSISFPIAIGSSQVQNLGATEFNVTFLPTSTYWPYISAGFEGEWGISYQTYYAGIEIGKEF